MEIVLLALGGIVIAVVVGTAWYMPITPMGRLHMRYLGFDKLTPEEQKQKIEAAKPTMWKMYLGQMILSLLSSVAVVAIITMSMQNGMTFSAALGFVLFNWLCFVVPAVGGNILWGNCESAIAWKKFFSDIGCFLATFLLTALLASLFV